MVYTRLTGWYSTLYLTILGNRLRLKRNNSDTSGKYKLYNKSRFYVWTPNYF
jgi:hypothetical protein